jgi:hypothetical protein
MSIHAMSTAEDVYELVTQLAPKERLRLVEIIAHGLLLAPAHARPAPAHAACDWAQLAGAAPGLLGGADAQESVSQSRRESDDARERAFGRGT